MIRYSFEKVNEISNALRATLPDETINIINFIAHKVGAPTYKKTPNFNKKRKVEKITNDDWAAIRNFKKTVMNKNTEGLLLEIDEIRSLLNKITNKSYNEIKTNILEKMKSCKDKFSYDEFMKIGKLVFEIGSMNKYCSHLYAQLYKDLSLEFPVFNKISNNNFVEYSKIFDVIHFIDSEVDYNLYCDYNKENENRKSMSLFFVNLMNYDVFDSDKIVHLILTLIKKIEEEVILENKKEIVEEIVSNLIILIAKTFETLNSHKNWQIISDHIKKFSTASKDNFKSLTAKTLFKYLDLVEKLELDE